jgi:hypothetical protein
MTSGEYDYHFLCVCSTHYLSNMHRFKVLHVFMVVFCGVMSISTGSGRLRPEVTSPVDGMTMVSYFCFGNTFCLSCTVSTI